MDKITSKRQINYNLTFTEGYWFLHCGLLNENGYPNPVQIQHDKGILYKRRDRNLEYELIFKTTFEG